MRPLFFLICCVFVYAGAVNYGGFDFFPALPFAAFVVYAALQWKGRYLVAATVLAMICVPLYALKKGHGRLFHPPLGQEIVTTKEFCLIQHRNDDGPPIVLAREILPEVPCDASNLRGATAWKVIPAGTVFKISSISVSNADFGETYVIHAPTEFGEMSYYPHRRNSEIFSWKDGRPFHEKDLRRGIFYVPSLLMYWPMTPLFLGLGK